MYWLNFEKSLRKSLLSIVVAMCWLMVDSGSALSDTWQKNRWAAGVQVSLARTSFGGKTIEESPAKRTPIHGVSVGAFVYVRLVSRKYLDLGFQAGAAYAPRGADQSLEGKHLSKSEYSYLEFPLLIRLESNLSNSFSGYVIGGMVPGILLTATQTDDEGQTIERRNDVKSIDLGLASGIGAKVALVDNVDVGIEARYVDGVINFVNSGDSEVYNRAILLTVGVSVRVGETTVE